MIELADNLIPKCGGIYALISDKKAYVGCATNLQNRLQRHKRNASIWSSLLDVPKSFSIKILETNVSKDKLIEREIYWAMYLSEAGYEIISYHTNYNWQGGNRKHH